MNALALLQVDPEAAIGMTWNLLLMTGVVGIATTAIMQGLKKWLVFVDELPKAVKQLIVLVLAWGLALLGKFFGITIPTDLAVFGTAEIQAVLASGFSMGAYTVLKAFGIIKPKPEGGVTPPL